MRLRERLTFGRDVAIMETVVVDINLIEEFEEDRNAGKGILQSLLSIVPRHQSGPVTKGITQAIAHAMPVGRAKAHVLTHRLSRHLFIGIVVMKGERVIGVGALVFNFRDIGKVF